MTHVQGPISFLGKPDPNTYGSSTIKFQSHGGMESDQGVRRPITRTKVALMVHVTFHAGRRIDDGKKSADDVDTGRLDRGLIRTTCGCRGEGPSTMDRSRRCDDSRPLPTCGFLATCRKSTSSVSSSINVHVHAPIYYDRFHLSCFVPGFLHHAIDAVVVGQFLRRTKPPAIARPFSYPTYAYSQLLQGRDRKVCSASFDVARVTKRRQKQVSHRAKA